jgi:DNA-binding response OmpR family regulator
MTALGTPEVTAGALQLGACTVLSKPFNMHDLDAIVRTHGQRRSSLQ